MLCRKEVASLAASLALPSWLGGCGSGRVSPLCGPGGQHQGIPSARHGSPRLAPSTCRTFAKFWPISVGPDGHTVLREASQWLVFGIPMGVGRSGSKQ